MKWVYYIITFKLGQSLKFFKRNNQSYLTIKIVLPHPTIHFTIEICKMSLDLI